MSHLGIRTLIQEVSQSLGDDIQFTYARVSDFNVKRDKRYPFITLDPLPATPEYSVDNTTNFTKNWQVSMGFYFLDKSSSSPEQYAKLLDEADVLVDQFINKLNFYSLRSDSIVISTMDQRPFVKATADILTGYLLTFSIQATDDFNYCGYDC